MPPPPGFEYIVLRGQAAHRFLAKLERDDPQHVMAPATGNYKGANERR